MRIIPRHLNAQLVLLVSCILLITGAISGWVTARQHSNTLLATMREHSAVMAGSFSENAAHYLVLQDYAGLESFLLRSADLPDIAHLQVCERDGIVVGDVEHLSGKAPRVLPGIKRITPPLTPSTLTTIENGTMIIWAPIKAGTMLGWIKATYSMAAIRDAQTGIWRNSLLLALFWVACSVALLLLVLRPLVQAINRLAAFARSLDERKGDQLAAAHRTIEIEELGTSLNYASTRLSSTEQQLIHERERLRVTLRSIHDGVIAADAAGTVMFMNSSGEVLTGWFAAEAAGRKVDEVFRLQASLPRDPAGSLLSAVMGSAAVVELGLDAVLVAKNGRERSIAGSAAPMQDDGGNLSGVVIVFRDITEHMQAEQKLALLNFALNNVSEEAYLINEQARFDYVNDQSCSALGYSREELLGMNVASVDPDFPVELWPGHWRDLRERGSITFEGHHRRKDGRIYPVEISANYFEYEGQGYNLALARDITERKRAEETLRDREQRYRDIFDNVLDGLYLLDVTEDGRFRTVEVNPALEHATGLSRDMVVGRTQEECVPEETARIVNAKYHRCVEAGRPIEEEVQLDLPSGRRYFHSTLIPARDDSGRINRIVGISRDITERKRTEEELRRTNELLERVFSASQTMIAYLDREFTFIRVNQEYAAADNRTPDYYPGKNHFALYPNAENEKIFRTVISTGTPYAAYEKAFEYSERPERGTTYWDWTLQPVKEADGTVSGLVLILQNVTARKLASMEREKLEQQLRQAQKMEAIGTLAGGVAHDFNNILTAIIGYSNILKLKMRSDDPLRSAVDQILTSSNRAAHLTQGLLAFSRKQVINPRPVDLNDIVRSIEKLLRRIIGEDIDLSTLLAGTSLIAMADTGQIEQVLMNLATNARDAMPEGGALTIRTEEIEPGADFITAQGCGKPGKYALISVSDTGQGMDEPTREKIFEPFFTTKDPGKGTGLGLAIVYGIVKQHEGAINVYSEPGKGTTFKIYIPLAVSEIEKPPAAVMEPPRGGTETILLAEDDEVVRGLIRNILTDFGYRVIDSFDGQDVLDKFATSAKNVDLLILDVIMPRKSGKEVYDAVKAIRPDLTVLFISGYTADFLHTKGIFEEGIEFLSKPISPFALLQKIRDLLDKRRRTD